jgi:hypothetical protein
LRRRENRSEIANERSASWCISDRVIRWRLAVADWRLRARNHQSTHQSPITRHAAAYRATAGWFCG